MPTSTRSTGYKKKPSSEPAQGGRKPPKATVTVHSDGTVTAKGPGATKAKAAAEASIPRVEGAVEKAEQKEAFKPPKFTPSPPRTKGALARLEALKLKDQAESGLSLSDIGNAVKDAVRAATAQDPTSSITRKYLEGEAKNLAEVAKESVSAGRQARGIVKAPSSKETQAALTIIGGTTGGAEAGAGEKALAKAASEASNAKSAAKVGERIVAKIKAAPKQAAKDLKEYPGRKARAVKATPKKIKATVARAPELKTKAGQKAAAKTAAKGAAKHPLKTGVPAAAALPPGAEIHGFDPGQRARAFLEGTAAAANPFGGHLPETLATTGKGALGFLTAPVALAGAGVASVKEGSPAPIGGEISTLAKGTFDMGKKLASGNPHVVEQTTRKETGLTPFIPVPHIVRRLKGTDAYEGARAGVRGAVEGRRAATRESRIAAEKAAQEGGHFVARKKARKVRQSVADTARPGEHYVLRRTGKLIEKQRSRHHVSREVARMQEEGQFAGKRESESVAKPLRRSPGTDHSQQNDADALAVILKHGLPIDKRTLQFAERLKKGYGEVEHGDIPAGVHLDRHSVQWILDHPEMFEGKRAKALTAAVEQFDRQAEDVGTSRRHRHVAQVLNLLNPMLEDQGKHPILLPEERVTPETLSLLPKREKPWSRLEALDYAEQLKGGNKADKALAKEIGGSMSGLMKPPEHGGAAGGISTTQADAYTPEMESAFAREAEAARSLLGLRRPSAYVANKVPKGLKGEDKAPDFGAELPLRKIWPSRGIAAKSGNAQSDFEHLMHSSVESPRQRKAVIKGLNRVFERASRPVEGKHYMTEAEVEKAINTHKVPEGTIFLRTQALKSILEGEHTVDSDAFRRRLEGEIENGQALASGDQIATEMAALKGMKGEKFAPMDAAAINELMGHLQPLGKVTQIAAHSTNLATRTILNSPAFALIQVPQEGLPLAAALGANVVRIPAAIKNLRKVADLPAEDQAAIKAVVGSSVGVLGAPSIKALRADGYMDPIRAAGGTGGKYGWRHAWNLVNGNTLGKFDRARAGLFREVAADAKVQGDFKKAVKGFNAWRRGANNLFKGEQEAVEAMKGMNRPERMAYVADHPKLGDKLMRAMNDMAGNWNSFTVFEKHFAPLTIFYPFQRYSVLWMLYHFPLDHPVVATALTTLGQVNAQELQAIAAEHHSTPSVLDYTMPVVNTGNGKKTVLPAGQRVFPGLASVQQAAVTDNPAQLIGEASPPLAIGIEAATGKSAYTGQDIGENGWIYMLRQAGNLSPLGRFIGIPDLGKSQSATSKAFEAEDPLRKFRSTIDPFIGQTATQYGNTKRLEKEEDVAHDPNKDVPGFFDMPNVQKLLYGGRNGEPEPKLLPQVLKEIHEGEAAKGFLKGKTQRYYGGPTPYSELREELQRAIEDAWETGPNGKKKSEGQYSSGTGQYSKGPGQYSKGPGQYSAGPGQYGG